MEVEINRGGCIACGLCTSICPEVFQIVEDGFAAVVQQDVPESLQSKVIEAQEECPVSVITAQE